MPCQLGLDNSDEHGGIYRGKDIGKKFGKIYLQLALDGYIDCESKGGPLLSLKMEKKMSEKEPDAFNPENPFFYELFGNDEDNRLDDIFCAGILDSDGTCKKCPYLQK